MNNIGYLWLEQWALCRVCKAGKLSVRLVIISLIVSLICWTISPPTLILSILSVIGTSR